eukprot:g490.t1
MASLASSTLPFDDLLPWISDSTDLGRRVRTEIESDGYCVLRNVLTKRECLREIDRIWDYIETISSSGISRDNPSSWYQIASSDANKSQTKGAASSTTTPPKPPLKSKPSGSVDPWPYTGWGSFPDMFQSQQAGWLFSELRTLLAERVFAPIYGTPELLLHCAEGFTFHRPTPADGRHPLGLGKRVVSVCGKQCELSIGEHFDQSASVEGLRRIQSSVALLDQTINDGCFVCWPGSHRAHPALIKATWRGRSDWVPLTDAELGKLQEQGFERRRVPVRAGDVILWRPDLAHCGASPIGVRENFRAVSYNCFLPASFLRGGSAVAGEVEDSILPKRLEAYTGMQTGDSGLPNDRRKDLSVRPYFTDGPPRLTWRQAQFYGLVPYDEGKRTRAEIRAGAEARGVRFSD